MRDVVGFHSNVTTDGDPRISYFGRFWRKTKIDELPQLINVLIGDMSFVGPRPDVPGFADTLEGDSRRILELRPGITGPASLYYRNEETLLAEQHDPEQFNRSIIWPRKVFLNLDYLSNYSFFLDLKLILATLTPLFRKDILNYLERRINDEYK